MPDRPEHRLRHRLGRRGLMLTLMGLTYVLIGIGVLIRPDISTVDDAYELLIPKLIRGIAWLVTGFLAAVFAWRKMPPSRPAGELRWLDGDRIGWMALYVMPFIRITSYGGSWICWVASEISSRFSLDGGEWLSGGTATAWYPAILHAPLILIVLICSGWRENATTEMTFAEPPKEAH